MKVQSKVLLTCLTFFLVLFNLPTLRVDGQGFGVNHQFYHQLGEYQILIETQTNGIGQFYPSLLADDEVKKKPAGLWFKLEARDWNLQPLTQCQACSLTLRTDKGVDRVVQIDGDQETELTFESNSTLVKIPFTNLGTYGIIFASNQAQSPASKINQSEYVGRKDFTWPEKAGLLVSLSLTLYLFYRFIKAWHWPIHFDA